MARSILFLLVIIASSATSYRRGGSRRKGLSNFHALDLETLRERLVQENRELAVNERRFETIRLRRTIYKAVRGKLLTMFHSSDEANHAGLPGRALDQESIEVELGKLSDLSELEASESSLSGIVFGQIQDGVSIVDMVAYLQAWIQSSLAASRKMSSQLQCARIRVRKLEDRLRQKELDQDVELFVGFLRAIHRTEQ